MAVRVPAKKQSRYAVYRPSIRNQTLQNRASARLAEGSKDPLSLSTGAVLAYDLDSEQVLYEKNADEPMGNRFHHQVDDRVGHCRISSQS